MWHTHIPGNVGLRRGQALPHSSLLPVGRSNLVFSSFSDSFGSSKLLLFQHTTSLSVCMCVCIVMSLWRPHCSLLAMGSPGQRLEARLMCHRLSNAHVHDSQQPPGRSTLWIHLFQSCRCAEKTGQTLSSDCASTPCHRCRCPPPGFIRSRTMFNVQDTYTSRTLCGGIHAETHAVSCPAFSLSGMS
jgi:hypothetical protein